MMNSPAEAQRARLGTLEATWGQDGLEQEVCELACERGPGNMVALVGGTEIGVTYPRIAEPRSPRRHKTLVIRHPSGWPR